VYGGSDDSDDNMSVRGSGVGCNNGAERTDPVLDSVPDLYSKLDVSSICISRPFSCSISHFLLTTYSINYCSNQILYYLVLRKMFYSGQGLKDLCCSSACTGYKEALQYETSI